MISSRHIHDIGTDWNSELNVQCVNCICIQGRQWCKRKRVHVVQVKEESHNGVRSHLFLTDVCVLREMKLLQGVRDIPVKWFLDWSDRALNGRVTDSNPFKWDSCCGSIDFLSARGLVIIDVVRATDNTPALFLAASPTHAERSRRGSGQKNCTFFLSRVQFLFVYNHFLWFDWFMILKYNSSLWKPE